MGKKEKKDKKDKKEKKPKKDKKEKKEKVEETEKPEEGKKFQIFSNTFATILSNKGYFRRYLCHSFIVFEG